MADASSPPSTHEIRRCSSRPRHATALVRIPTNLKAVWSKRGEVSVNGRPQFGADFTERFRASITFRDAGAASATHGGMISRNFGSAAVDRFCMKSIGTFAVALLLVACATDNPVGDAGDPDQPDAGPLEAHEQPAWMVGEWSSPWAKGGARGFNSYRLDANGTGTSRYVYARTMSDYAEDSGDSFAWWANQDTFAMGYRSELHITPNCRVLEIGGTDYPSARVSAECPFRPTPLSDAEKAVAGRRRYSEDALSVDVTFGEDRFFWFHVEGQEGYDPLEENHYGAWSLGSDGKLAFTTAANEQLSLGVYRLAFAADGLEVCSFYGCAIMH